MKRLINVNSFLIFFSFLLGMSCTNKVYDAEKLTSIADSCYKADNSLVSVSAMQPFFSSLCFLPLQQHLLKSQNYVSSRTIQKCVEHVSTST